MSSSETVAIEPYNIQMERSLTSGAPQKEVQSPTKSPVKGKGSKPKSETSSKEQPIIEKISRMIDWTMGLLIDPTEWGHVIRYLSTQVEFGRSINQTIGYLSNVPCYLDFEIKKANPSEAPVVQVAVWEAAQYKKRQLHGWDTSFPMPCVTVEGHNWLLWIIYEKEKDSLVSDFLPVINDWNC